MPQIIIVDENGNETILQISETEARRQRLGLPETATETEINDAWAALQTALQAEQSAEATLDQLRELANTALRAIDWTQKVNQVAAGHSAVTNSRALITSLRAATTLNEARTRAADALDIHANVLDGLIDEAEDNLRRWRRLLQRFAMTDDPTL